MIDAIPPFDVFIVDAFELESGAKLPQTRLAYRILGDPHREPTVLSCTAFSQTPLDLGYLTKPGGPLAPEGRALIQTELLGNGRSSSPSNTPAPYAGPDFPAFTIADNVRLQRQLVDHLGVKRLDCVFGASMGGQQALEWGVRYPEIVASVIAIAANLQTNIYGQLFLHTVRSALTSDPAFEDGRYQVPPLLGLSRLSEAWAPFALSPRFFSRGRWKAHADMAGADLAEFLAKWRTRYHGKDANDLLTHLHAWFHHDVANGRPLAEVGARTLTQMLLIPISTDAYFNPDDVREQAEHFPNASLEVVESDSGHAGAFGREPTDQAAIIAIVSRFLARRESNEQPPTAGTL